MRLAGTVYYDSERDIYKIMLTNGKMFNLTGQTVKFFTDGEAVLNGILRHREADTVDGSVSESSSAGLKELT